MIWGWICWTALLFVIDAVVASGTLYWHHNREIGNLLPTVYRLKVVYHIARQHKRKLVLYSYSRVSFCSVVLLPDEISCVSVLPTGTVQVGGSIHILSTTLEQSSSDILFHGEISPFTAPFKGLNWIDTVELPPRLRFHEPLVELSKKLTHGLIKRTAPMTSSASSRSGSSDNNIVAVNWQCMETFQRHSSSSSSSSSNKIIKAIGRGGSISKQYEHHAMHACTEDGIKSVHSFVRKYLPAIATDTKIHGQPVIYVVISHKDHMGIKRVLAEGFKMFPDAVMGLDEVDKAELNSYTKPQAALEAQIILDAQWVLHVGMQGQRANHDSHYHRTNNASAIVAAAVAGTTATDSRSWDSISLIEYERMKRDLPYCLSHTKSRTYGSDGGGRFSTTDNYNSSTAMKDLDSWCGQQFLRQQQQQQHRRLLLKGNDVSRDVARSDSTSTTTTTTTTDSIPAYRAIANSTTKTNDIQLSSGLQGDYSMLDRPSLYWKPMKDGMFSNFMRMKMMLKVAQLYKHKLVVEDSHTMHVAGTTINWCSAFDLTTDNITCVRKIPAHVRCIHQQPELQSYLQAYTIRQKSNENVTTITNITAGNSLENDKLQMGICYAGVVTARTYEKRVNAHMNDTASNIHFAQPTRQDWLEAVLWPPRLRYHSTHVAKAAVFKKALFGHSEDIKAPITVVHWRRGDQLHSRCVEHIDTSVNCQKAKEFIRRVKPFVNRTITHTTAGDTKPVDPVVYVATNEYRKDRLSDLHHEGYRTFFEVLSNWHGGQNAQKISGTMKRHSTSAPAKQLGKLNLVEILLIETILMLEADTFLAWGVSEMNDVIESERFLKNRNEALSYCVAEYYTGSNTRTGARSSTGSSDGISSTSRTNAQAAAKVIHPESMTWCQYYFHQNQQTPS